MSKRPPPAHRFGLPKLTALSFVTLISAGEIGAQGGSAPAVRIQPGQAAHWSLTVREKAETEKKEEAPGDGGGEIPTDTGGGEAKPAVVRSEYVVTGNTGRAVTKAGEGKRVEIYMFRREKDTLLFNWSESARRVVPTILDQYVGPEMRFSRSYPGVDWVRGTEYRGVVAFGGRDCHHFSMAPARPSPQELVARADSLAYDPRISSVPREAWFEVATGLPMGFRDGTRWGKFRHHEAPTEAVKLPSAFNVALRYYYGAGPRPETLDAPPITAPDPPEVPDEEEEEGDPGGDR